VPTCSLGDACQNVPFQAPTGSEVGEDGTNPYQGAAGHIGKRDVPEGKYTLARKSIDVKKMLEWARKVSRSKSLNMFNGALKRSVSSRAKNYFKRRG
jgi:hypothetical protein